MPLLPWLGGWGDGSPGTSACPAPSTPCGAALRPTRAPCSSPGELGSPGCTGLVESKGPPHPALPRPPCHAHHAALSPAPPLLTVQPSRAVWYSAASVASLSSSWYRGQLRVGNLSSWGETEAQRGQLDWDPSPSRGHGELGPLSLVQISLQTTRSLPNLATQHGDGSSPHRDGSAPGEASVPLPGAARLGQTASLGHWLPPPRGLCPSLSLPPPAPAQPPDLVLGDWHCVHRDGPPGSLWAPRGSLREQPCEVGLSALQRAVKVSAADIHLGWRGGGQRSAAAANQKLQIQFKVEVRG